MHPDIIKEYNNPGFYNEDKWSTLGLHSSERFEEKPIDWQTSKKYLQMLAKNMRKHSRIIRNLENMEILVIQTAIII